MMLFEIRVDLFDLIAVAIGLLGILIFIIASVVSGRKRDKGRRS